MSKEHKLTVRLNDDRNDKLEQLAAQRGDIAKVDVIRQLIDGADPSSQVLAEMNAKIDKITEAVGADTPREAPTEESVDVDETMPATPTQTDSAPAMITADGGASIPVDVLSPSHIAKNNIKIQPGDYSDDLPENVSKTTGLLVGVLNWMREHQPYDEGMRLDELDRTIKLVTGRGKDTVEQYRDALIDQGHVFVSPLLDPMLEARWDDLLTKVYGGSGYQKREKRGILADDVSDLLGGWWLEQMADARVHLSREEYVQKATDLLFDIEDKMIRRWSSADRRSDRGDAWNAWREVYFELVQIASARTGGEVERDRGARFMDQLLPGGFADEQVVDEWFEESSFVALPEPDSESASGLPSAGD